VLLNAAAALIVAGRAETLRDGAAMAARSLDAGAALDVLRKLRAAAAPPPAAQPDISRS
jgi:anthranilate phosphoribosyltransferase